MYLGSIPGSASIFNSRNWFPVVSGSACLRHHKPFSPSARVAKSVDARDLKSLAVRRAGSSPAPGTNQPPMVRRDRAFDRPHVLTPTASAGSRFRRFNCVVTHASLGVMGSPRRSAGIMRLDRGGFERLLRFARIVWRRCITSMPSWTANSTVRDAVLRARTHRPCFFTRSLDIHSKTNKL